MSMDFFRRPQLAGSVLQYPAFPAIRGSVRRSLPDVNSTVPYFPTAGGTLLVLVDDSVTFTITLPVNVSLQSALSAINAATSGPQTFSNVALAYDDGGTIGLRTVNKNGSIEVTGGTAALSLGFDLRTGPIVSRPGELFSAPEGGLGNPYDAAFPTPGENLNSISFVRALARISSNLDILNADLSRTKTRLAKVGTITTGTLLGGSTTSYACPITFSDSHGVSNGLGTLSRTSTADEIAPFFVLIDPSSNRLPDTEVIGAVIGTVTGNPPYADAPNRAGNGNVLGINLSKAGPYAVESILRGRFVYRAGGFGSAKVGDYVSFTGDVNTSVTPWSNLGLRWKVDWISQDGTSLSLAPLSKAELADVNTSGTEYQPIVALNDVKGGSENYGSIYLHTGPVIEDPVLVVSPNVPTGKTYDLYAAVPVSERTASHSDFHTLTTPLLRALRAPKLFVTVGPYGDFPTMQTAIDYLNTGAYFSGVREIIVTDNQATATGWNFGSMELLIRAASPGVGLGWNPAASLAIGSGRIIFMGFDLSLDDAPGIFSGGGEFFAIDCYGDGGFYEFFRSTADCVRVNGINRHIHTPGTLYLDGNFTIGQGVVTKTGYFEALFSDSVDTAIRLSSDGSGVFLRLSDAGVSAYLRRTHIATLTTGANADALHVHAHGDQAGGSLHALAVAGGAAGFLSGADKTDLDTLTGGTSSDASALHTHNRLKFAPALAALANSKRNDGANRYSGLAHDPVNRVWYALRTTIANVAGPGEVWMGLTFQDLTSRATAFSNHPPISGRQMNDMVLASDRLICVGGDGANADIRTYTGLGTLGGTWTTVSSGLASPEALTVWARSSDRTRIMLRASGTKACLSTNSGASFSEITLPADTVGVWWDPFYSEWVCIGGSQGFAPSNYRIRTSVNGGTWTDRGGVPTDIWFATVGIMLDGRVVIIGKAGSDAGFPGPYYTAPSTRDLTWTNVSPAWMDATAYMMTGVPRFTPHRAGEPLFAAADGAILYSWDGLVWEYVVSDFSDPVEILGEFGAHKYCMISAGYLVESLGF